MRALGKLLAMIARAALDEAVDLSTSGLPHYEVIKKLGEGWVAEEALAIPYIAPWWQRVLKTRLCWR